MSEKEFTMQKILIGVSIIVGIIAIATPIIVVGTSLKQTEQNTKDILQLKNQFSDIGNKLSAIDSNVKLLIDGKIKN